jgi:hypothetical protein
MALSTMLRPGGSDVQRLRSAFPRFAEALIQWLIDRRKGTSTHRTLSGISGWLLRTIYRLEKQVVVDSMVEHLASRGEDGIVEALLSLLQKEKCEGDSVELLVWIRGSLSRATLLVIRDDARFKALGQYCFELEPLKESIEFVERALVERITNDEGFNNHKNKHRPADLAQIAVDHRLRGSTRAVLIRLASEVRNRLHKQRFKYDDALQDRRFDHARSSMQPFKVPMDLMQLDNKLKRWAKVHNHLINCHMVRLAVLAASCPYSPLATTCLVGHVCPRAEDETSRRRCSGRRRATRRRRRRGRSPGRTDG